MKEVPNLNYIDQLSGDDTVFRAKFIEILKLEFPDEKSQYLKAIGQKDYSTASETVHKIKHKLNMLGLHHSHDLAVRHENELRNGSALLTIELLQVLENTQQYLNTL
jgi:HPt (histidine-containing phosphotransfer) domain-containing protein